jgi:hypothetical protein
MKTQHMRSIAIESCLMFWSAESGSGIADMVSGGSAQIRSADLKANGEEKNTIKPLVFFK